MCNKIMNNIIKIIGAASLICVHSVSADGVNDCDPAPIKNDKNAICYGKWHSKVVSTVSRYGYKYEAQKYKNIWKVTIREKSPGTSVTEVLIEESDGSLVGMNEK